MDGFNGIFGIVYNWIGLYPCNGKLANCNEFLLVIKLQ